MCAVWRTADVQVYVLGNVDGERVLDQFPRLTPSIVGPIDPADLVSAALRCALLLQLLHDSTAAGSYASKCAQGG